MMEVSEIVSRLENSVQTVMLGQEEAVRRVLATMMAGGHVLLEDVPGTGKTTLAKAIAASMGGAHFQRIQFTPDLLPSDILGVSVLDSKSSSFEFHQGPIFSDILLADEVNRASPRTQSALLEAMAEKQVTVEGRHYDLGELFFVIATQNPVELRGTYPLPEAQMDRFAYQCSLGYVSVDQEMAILNAQEKAHPLSQVQSVVDRDDLLRVRQAVAQVAITPARGRAGVKLAASPRASLNLLRISQALSLFEGRDFVLPETIQSLAAGVIGHRLVLEADAQYAGRTGQSVVNEIVQELAVPV